MTTVFALLAEGMLVRARFRITPPGFGWTGLNEQRARFLPHFGRLERLTFWITLGGTLIWAYGDLLF